MFFERPEAGRRALLVHLLRQDQGRTPEQDAMAQQEGMELAGSAGLVVADLITASRATPHPRFFVGEGKLETIAQALVDQDADLLLINQDLSAGQQRNLEQRLQCRVMSRTELILHIFADRARTHEGQLQVELAQLQHAQTRLIRGWTHLDRQKGGIGLRGAGETQLEMDQRMLGDRLKAVKKRLAEVASRRAQGRRRRQRTRTPTVALVGYTNAGKSTLFNALTTAAVAAEDRLFATLDPTMRRIDIPGVGPVVLADTVGFISDLPHTLVDAFKATLEEVAGADLLLHVVDASAVNRDAHRKEVAQVLEDIGAAAVPQLLVLNKMDLLAPEEQDDPLLHQSHSVPICARTGAGLTLLRQKISAAFGVTRLELVLPMAEGRTRAWLYEQGAVMSEQHREDGTMALSIRADPVVVARLERNPRVFLQAVEGLPRISRLPN